jgi:hypothetical protein
MGISVYSYVWRVWVSDISISHMSIVINNISEIGISETGGSQRYRKTDLSRPIFHYNTLFTQSN